MNHPFALVVAIILAAMVHACNPDPSEESLPQYTGGGSQGSGDGGTEPRDAANPTRDAGTLPRDAGRVDSGTARADGSVHPDPTCPGVPLVADGVLPLDMKTVRVSGRVTLQGQGDWDSTDRMVEFTLKANGSTVMVGLEEDATYEVVLSPGVYDVSLAPTETGCEDPTAPCNRVVLKRGVALTASGSLDVDVPVVNVLLAISFNQARPSAAGGSTRLGTLQLESTGDHGNAEVEVDTTADSYSLSIAPGSYQARWVGNEWGCGTRSPMGLTVACGTGVVTSVLPLTASGEVRVDVPSVCPEGNITVEGGAATGGGTRQVVFKSTRGQLALEVDDTAPSHYRTCLVPDTYDVEYQGSGNTGGDWPVSAGVLKQRVVLTASGNLDIDVPVVRIEGNITVDGAPLPSSRMGRLSFSSVQGTASVPITLSGSMSRYQARLLPGTYDLMHIPDPYGCSNGTTHCMPAQLGSNVSVEADGVLDRDIHLVAVTLGVTLKGAAFSSSSNAASVVLEDPYGGTASWTLPLTGSQVLVPPGIYALRYTGPRCSGTTTAPCGSTLLKQGVSITSDGALSGDVPGVQVDYALTVGGADFPGGGDGVLQFVPVDVEMGAINHPVSTGQGRVFMVPGAYVVDWQPGESCWWEGNRLPCTAQVLAGCR